MFISRLTGLVLMLLGALISSGGLWLLLRGGVFYYFLVGLAFILCGVFAFWRHAVALLIYTVIVTYTLAWALGEVGLDWWQLVPRGGLIVLVGICIALPRVVRAFSDSRLRKTGWVALQMSLAASMAVGAFAALIPGGYSGELGEKIKPTMLAGEERSSDWLAYGGTNLGQRYSPLDHITPANVASLQRIWQFRTSDMRGKDDTRRTNFEVTPLKIGNTLYVCTPQHFVIALDAETGHEKWRFDTAPPDIDVQTLPPLTCRGLSFYSRPVSAVVDPCAQRLYVPTIDARIVALSAANGERCTDFGDGDGAVDLTENMPSNPHPAIGNYYVTSPPLVTKSLLVVGGLVIDNRSASEASGVIRAFDLQTGKLEWAWDSGNPESSEPLRGAQTYSANSPNSWSVSSYDPELGLIYIPTGNASPDQFGGQRRPADEKYSSSIVALHEATGKVAWVFQTVAHDLWDMDVPAQPSLIDLSIADIRVPALVAATKQGDVYVLDRRTGKPILPVEYESAPQGAVEGDFVAIRQPTSTLSFKPPPLTEASMWGVTLFDQLYCRIRFRSLDYRGRYTPPSLHETLTYPGNYGVFNWGGVAVDPKRDIMFAMPTYLAFTYQLIPRTNATEPIVLPDGGWVHQNYGAPYAVIMGPFLSPLGIPCQAPPWGYIAGADLTTGKIAYMHPNGTVRDLAPIPLSIRLGVPGIGGPILTKSGVAFLSATLDYYLRAYNVTDGKMLWEERLPAGGQSTPISYWSEQSQRQFVVIAAGGHNSTKSGSDWIIAYALPKQ